MQYVCSMCAGRGQSDLNSRCDFLICLFTNSSESIERMVRSDIFLVFYRVFCSFFGEKSRTRYGD